MTTQQDIPGPSQANEALSRLKESILRAQSPETSTISITKEDAEWLVAEIEGGREAFQSVVSQKQQAEARVMAIEQTIETLLALRDRLLAEIGDLKKRPFSTHGRRPQT